MFIMYIVKSPSSCFVMFLMHLTGDGLGAWFCFNKETSLTLLVNIFPSETKFFRPPNCSINDIKIRMFNHFSLATQKDFSWTLILLTPTTSIAQSESLPCCWINLMPRTWLMGRKLWSVASSWRVDNIRRTTQVTLEWDGWITTRNTKQRIHASPSLLLCFKFIFCWRLKSDWFPLPLSFTCPSSF